jgi:hypothetical protein
MRALQLSIQTHRSETTPKLFVRPHTIVLSTQHFKQHSATLKHTTLLLRKRNKPS